MNSNELRERFVTFFKQRDHTVVPSDSLIPSGDPTVLFTSAGMNQFKDSFLGKRTDLSRAASCQKCLRTGDLEHVGKTPHHHTFFEMLGNFSFGDYFKREAIQWAWEFLTTDIKLPKNKLWVTVFQEDDEAFEIWQTIVPARRIVRLGEADNFWPANARTHGPNGPCGPCSEIHFDRTGKCLKGRADCSPGCGCGRFVEVWNLVFTQFDRQEDGALVPLPKPNIDTGMGLERLASVVQGTETDYETDLFNPIINAIRMLKMGERAKTDQIIFTERAIADHIRAIVFLINDGVRPSNESRGYVLRMLIRRAHRLGRSVRGIRLDQFRKETGGYLEGFLIPLIDEVRSTMVDSPYYAELLKNRDLTFHVIEQEEAQFAQTLESGVAILADLSSKALKTKEKTISGEEAFRLYDTYGFPLELTIDIAKESGLTVDRAGFEHALKAQQQRSRAGSQFGQGIFIPTTLTLKDVSKSEFAGYEILQADATVKGIWKNGEWASNAHAGDEVGIILDRSPFYGEAGGQIGDRGTIEAPHGVLDVVNTTWVDELLVHHAKVRQGTVAVEEPVRATVDAPHRLRVARSHTATHLLHWALRNVLGPETVQAGSLVDTERVRFDFSALKGLHEEQWLAVEQLVNERIRNADQVQADVMELEQAKRAGALAFFGEKYSQRVRVVSIGDYSKELCGGTHLHHTGEAGIFRIVSESSIAAGTRRIEAVVGETASLRQQRESQLLREVARRLSRPPEEVVKGLEELLEQLKHSERDRQAQELELAKAKAKELLNEGKQIKDVTFIATTVKNADRESLAVLADAVRASFPGEGAVCLASGDQGTVSVVMATTSGLVKKVDAGEIMKEITSLIKGSGGGRPEFAQGGGKDPSGIQAAFKRAGELIQQALER